VLSLYPPLQPLDISIQHLQIAPVVLLPAHRLLMVDLDGIVEVIDFFE
jgi:hypothetical protein